VAGLGRSTMTSSPAFSSTCCLQAFTAFVITASRQRRARPNHTVELDNIKPPPLYDATKGPQIITSDVARQGPKGTRVYAVLVASLIVLVVALFLVARFVH